MRINDLRTLYKIDVYFSTKFLAKIDLDLIMGE